ncbi:acetyl-CoA decarbonylase/synthase complex subunit gamma [Candidatus Formimonas warabiya]|uniref:Acetyl-CoA decarbonylase/synthase complex subunit gamma n=1 Tax=Formimonas warabiya TaxID=1761012 RepID=A0A3G1KPH7_FORW1|nr:acetyl-CoA decarbonylase/synthase complex subunit gamma [Candidatus Formimonas warabiya]ATW24373.1 acetyl-CoA decarbonylase/synthase complex subunit gamma [Candidatus Formimonas warabiya]
MGLTGLAIFKELPKKNCGECGVPTCLAFAMALAAGKATLETCPYVTEAAKEALGSASAPPIKLVKVGAGDSKVVELGDETVMFRHDKTFYHPTGIAFEVEDTLDEAALTEKIAQINDLEFDRVGLHYTVDMVAIKNASGNADTFAGAVKKVAEASKLALVLMSDDSAAMEKALETVTARKPLIYAATTDNFEAMTALAKKYEAPLAVKGANLDELEDVVNKVVALGHKDLVLDPGSRKTVDVLADLTQLRRMTIKKKFRPFGYPVMAFTTETDPMDEAMQAQVYISKYASMIVLKTVEKQFVMPILSWRQNIYTDPQKPIQVESKIYEVGAVNENSPVYITTNFSLSYYSVEGEVEASKIPSYIIPIDTDGTSVLTAWAAGKFGGDKIAEVMKSLGIEQKVSHRNVVIPGYVAVIAAKLKEDSGWNVMVGPREAAGISPFARANFS